MVDFEVTFSDPEFFDAVENPERFLPVFMRAAETIVLEAINLMSEYPPTTEANQPGRFSLATHRPMGYYERGRGWWYPVATRGALGGGRLRRITPEMASIKTRSVTTLKAGNFEGVAGYKLRATSERMDSDWSYEIGLGPSGPLAIISNSASYASFVVGDQQAAVHAAREWRRVDEIWASHEMDLIIKDNLISAIAEYYRLAEG